MSIEFTKTGTARRQAFYNKLLMFWEKRGEGERRQEVVRSEGACGGAATNSSLIAK